MRTRGEGCLRIRHDGRWEGRYVAGYDLLTGKRIVKSVYSKSKTECSALLAKAIRENTGPYYRMGKGSGDQTLAAWLRYWFKTYCAPNIRPTTYDSYNNIIENHVVPMLGNVLLRKLTSMHVQQMYNELRKRGRLATSGERSYEPLASSTVQHVHMVLNSCLQQATRDRLIPFNPCENCKVPKKERREMNTLPTEKIGAYLDEARRQGVYAMFLLELTSGLRRGELLALLWSDLDVNARTLKVSKQLGRIKGELVVSEPKTQKSIRVIMLPEQTVEALIEEHELHPESPLMFCSPRTNGYWAPDSMYRIHKKILDAIGADRAVRFHDLRHTFATIAIQNGVDVKTISAMLGHTSSAFTLDTYTHVTEEMRRNAADKISVFINAQFNVNVNIIQNNQVNLYPVQSFEGSHINE